MGGIILFDGVCNFCNSSVQFIMKRDPKAFFKFASLQSETGKSLLLKYQITEDVDSLVLIEDDSYFIKSSAILRIFTGIMENLIRFSFRTYTNAEYIV